MADTYQVLNRKLKSLLDKKLGDFTHLLNQTHHECLVDALWLKNKPQTEEAKLQALKKLSDQALLTPFEQASFIDSQRAWVQTHLNSETNDFQSQFREFLEILANTHDLKPYEAYLVQEPQNYMPLSFNAAMTSYYRDFVRRGELEKYRALMDPETAERYQALKETEISFVEDNQFCEPFEFLRNEQQKTAMIPSLGSPLSDTLRVKLLKNGSKIELDIDTFSQGDVQLLQNYGFTHSASPIARVIETIGAQFYRPMILTSEPLKRGSQWHETDIEKRNKDKLIQDLFKTLRDKMLQELNCQTAGDFRRLYTSVRRDLGHILMQNASGVTDEGDVIGRDEKLLETLTQALKIIRVARGEDPTQIINLKNLHIQAADQLGHIHVFNSEQAIINSSELLQKSKNPYPEMRDMLSLLARHYEGRLDPYIQDRFSEHRLHLPEPRIIPFLEKNLEPPKVQDWDDRFVAGLEQFWGNLKFNLMNIPLVAGLAIQEVVSESRSEVVKFAEILEIKNRDPQILEALRTIERFKSENQALIETHGLPNVIANSFSQISLTLADYASNNPNKFTIAVLVSSLTGLGFLDPIRQVLLSTVLSGISQGDEKLNELFKELGIANTMTAGLNNIARAAGVNGLLTDFVSHAIEFGADSFDNVTRFVSQSRAKKDLAVEFLAAVGYLAANHHDLDAVFNKPFLKDRKKQAASQSKFFYSVFAIVPQLANYLFSLTLNVGIFLFGVLPLPLLPFVQGVRYGSGQIFLNTWLALFCQTLALGLLRPVEHLLQAVFQTIRMVYLLTTRIAGAFALFVTLIAPLASLFKLLETVSNYKGIRKIVPNFLKRGISSSARALNRTQMWLSHKMGDLEYWLLGAAANRLALGLHQMFDFLCHGLEKAVAQLESRNHALANGQRAVQALESQPLLSEHAIELSDISVQPVASNPRAINHAENLAERLEEVQHASFLEASQIPSPRTLRVQANQVFDLEAISQKLDRLKRVPHYQGLEYQVFSEAGDLEVSIDALPQVHIMKSGYLQACQIPNIASNELTEQQVGLLYELLPPGGCVISGGSAKALRQMIEQLKQKPDYPFLITETRLARLKKESPELALDYENHRRERQVAQREPKKSSPRPKFPT